MKIVCEYVWLGGDNELRSKIRVLNHTDSTNEIFSLENVPSWNYDGSSTKQALGNDSEVLLEPRALFINPFYGQNTFLVLCDTYRPDYKPLENNHRPYAIEVFNKGLSEKPWYGIEQEYFLMNKETGKPLGFPKDSNPNPQGQYYCGVGAQNSFGRKIAEEHMVFCLNAGINISGINAEVAPGQWEYQVGPCLGIVSGDQLWMSRYILERVAEKNDVVVCWEPKPLKGDWNGSGCHTNYSTRSMREGKDGKLGIYFINEAISKLSKKHEEHMKVYGTGNEERMTGEHETADYNVFTHGKANRGASVRIGNDVYKNGKGYFEDRRPSSNMNPYLVTAKIFETTVTNVTTVTDTELYDSDTNMEPQPSDVCSF